MPLRRVRHAVHLKVLGAVERAAAAALEPRLADQSRRHDEEIAATREEIAGLRRELLDELRAREVRDRRDMLAAGERDAVASSARFVREAMAGARTFPTPAQTLAHAIALAPTGGLACEFGVFRGTTLRAIADGRPGAVYGFDSFVGLPEPWRAGFGTGTFALDELPDVAGAELVVGPFAETLPGFLAEHAGVVDLLHIDADLYSSAVTVLEHVGPRLRPGSVVVFDEYLNHPGWQDGEHRAWIEYTERTGTAFEYEAFTHDSEQVVVVVG